MINEYDLLKSMNGIQEDFLLEAENAAEFRDNKKPIKRLPLILGIIAAAAFAVSAGVYAYQKLINRDTAELFFKDPELIENHENAVINQIWENDDVKITVDAVLSDGRRAVIMFTCEEKQKAGGYSSYRQFLNADALITYADEELKDSVIRNAKTGALPRIWSGFTEGNRTAGSPEMILSVIDLQDIDITRDVSVSFLLSKDPSVPIGTPQMVKEESGEVTFTYTLSDSFENYLEGLNLKLSLKPNVRKVCLRSADGHEVYLSGFELFTEDAAFRESFRYPEFIRNNGEKGTVQQLFGNTNQMLFIDNYVLFGTMLDPEDFKGVDLNGTEYFRVN